MTQSSEQQTPEQRIKILEKELEEARLKSDFSKLWLKSWIETLSSFVKKKRKAELLKKNG